MRKILISSFFFFMMLFAYGVYMSQISVSVLPEKLEPANFPGFYDYRGISNVHTSNGTGSGTPLQVIKAAQDAGLDFLFITDLNQFSKPQVPEGYHRQLLVMRGDQYSYLDSRMIIYDREKRHSLESLGQAQVLIADLLTQSEADAESDLLILAHPYKQGFSWTGDFPSGLDGIEILSLKSIWQYAWNNLRASFLWSMFVYPFNPQLALIRLMEDPQRELALWDQLSMKRTMIGMAGADATANSASLGDFPFRIPSYQSSFSLLSNHVLLRSELTGEVDGDRRKILGALASGQFYMSLDLFGNPKGFVAYLQNADEISPMGSRVKWEPGMKLVAHLPSRPKVPFEIAFFKDGQHIMSSTSLNSNYQLHGKGTYRVIVRVFTGLTLPDGQRWFTWIYTNPFYVE